MKEWYCKVNETPREIEKPSFKPKHIELKMDDVRKLWQSGEGMMKNPLRKKGIDDKVLKILSESKGLSEWDIARNIYDWDNLELRSKRGAWIRVIVQSLWRLQRRGLVGYFFDSNHARYWVAYVGILTARHK